MQNENDINSNYINVNINKIQKKENRLSTLNTNLKYRHISSFNFNKDRKKSTSINKIRVNGAMSRHQLNRKLIARMQKTPMKTEQNLRNAIKRNIGVRRGNNLSILNNKTIDNSFEEDNKKKEKVRNDNYSYVNFSTKNLKIDENNKKYINYKNSSNKYLLINQRSSSSDEDYYADENDNNYKYNNFRINPYESEEGDNYLEEKGKDLNIDNFKRYNIKKIYDKDIRNKIESNVPKIELISITKKRSPTIVINNNFNVNFENKSISTTRPFSKFKNFKIK